MARKGRFGLMMNVVAIAAMFLTTSCAMVDAPDARNVEIPSPKTADQRRTAINERPDSVMYLPLGEDVLVPEVAENDSFPSEMVGPFELRGETVAGALQLVLADYDISLAFESNEGLTRRITVANLRGDLGKVVHQICSLANLYCSYEDGTVTVKDSQTFTVTLPPIGTDDETEFLDDVAEGLKAILNPGSSSGTSSDASGSATIGDPIVDPTTRTIVYSATQRTADIASRYFQRLRANTAMIVFETYIWEVSLNSGNSTGVDWTQLAEFGAFHTGIKIDGSVGADFTNPISIGLPSRSDTFDGSSGDLFQFLSQFGAVKTISQPQITVLSGSQAELRVADTQNYVSQIATTFVDTQSTTSVNTDSVDTGFTLTIGSTWDKSTVYANVDIELTDVKGIDDYAFSDTSDGTGTGGTQTRIQLPQTSERQVSTQIRVRPGDSVLIAGLVRENDNFNERGPGIMEPILPDSRTAQSQNLELVVLLRPRVVVYTSSNDKRYVDYAMKKHKLPGTGVEMTSPADGGNVYPAPIVDPVQEEIPDGVAAPLSSAPLGVSATGGTPKVNPISAPRANSVVPATSVTPTPAPAASVNIPSSPTTAPAPVSVTPSWENKPAASPMAPGPAPVTPAPVSAAPLAPLPAAPMPILGNSGAAPDDGSRFRLGSGFVSKTGGAKTGEAAPSSSSVTTYPLEPQPAPAPAVPLYNPGANAAPAGSPAAAAPRQPSAYDTYDYYTPAY